MCKKLFLRVIVALIAVPSYVYSGSVNVSLVKPYIYTIMQTESIIGIAVTNTGTDNISQIQLTFPSGYSIIRGSSPNNWVVRGISSPGITFRANTCLDVLIPQNTVYFYITVIAPTGTEDVRTEIVSLWASRSAGPPGCRNGSSTASNSPPFTRYSLLVSIDASPSTVNVGSNILIVYSVTNKTSVPKSGILPSIAKISEDGGDCLLSSPSPPSLDLASGESGTITYTCRATSSGTILFRGYAYSGTTVTSPPTDSNSVAIGNFTAEMSLEPTSIVSGDDITLRMTVTNWGSTTITNIVPTSDCPSVPGGLCFSGSATSTYLSGPAPSYVSELLPGQSTTFVWNYVITGSVGSTFSYNGAAIADGGLSTNTAFSEIGEITVYSVSVDPSYVLRNSTNKTLTFLVKNNSQVGIKSVTVYNPDTSIWIKANQSGIPCQGCTWTYTRLTSPERYRFATNTTSCYIYKGEQCDFSVIFSQVGSATNPPSTTSYMFESQITDARSVISKFYNDVSVVVSPTPEDVDSLVTISRNSSVKLVWNNPADHNGVLVIRTVGDSTTCTPPNTNPADGTEYSIGETLGNATVVYTDSGGSTTNTYTDTGLTNGTVYCYKVYNHNNYFVYSSGNVPSSNGIKGHPTNGVEPNPLWVYTVGISSLFTPAVYPGTNLYTSSNLGTVNSINPLSGEELYRPIFLGGTVNNRFVVVPLEDGTKMILTGAQNGYAYGIYADTGVIRWSVQLTTDMITAPPAVILRKYANPAFRGKYSTDLAFFGTRNSDRVSNKVFAINPNNGSIVWTFNQSGGNAMDIIAAGPTVDYTNNWLYVNSYSGIFQNQSSLWILDIINDGSLLYSANYGDIDFGTVLTNNRTVASFASKSKGLIYSINASDRTLRWSFNPGLGTGVNFSYLLPLSDGFIFTASGHLIRIVDRGDSASLVYDTVIPGATPPLLAATWNKVYVGSNSGVLYQINLSSGSSEFTRSIGFAIGYMSADTLLKNIYFGTTDGRIFAFGVPFTK